MRTLQLLVAGLSFCLLSGCSTEFNLATQREESLMYGTEKEVRIGDKVAYQIEKKHELIEDVDANERVNRILDDIVAVCDRQDIVYTIRVIDDEEMVNAVSLPGGYIYIFSGMLDRLETDDQLAGVIAHEVGHITARHSIKRLQASYGFALLQAVAIASNEAAVMRGVNAMYPSIFVEYSRQDEFESDQLAVKYMKKAGYDPYGAIGVMEALEKKDSEGPLRRISYFRTHPYLNERKAVINQEITGQIGFKDYLNLTGNDY